MQVFQVLREAAQRRLAGDAQGALALLHPLEQTDGDHPFVPFEIGLTLDAMDLEAQAIPYYERAIALGLPHEQRCTALLGLGSSLRNAGLAEEAVTVLRDAAEQFPNHMGLRCFYALAQFDAGESAASVRTLMGAVLDLSPESVQPFAHGLRSYADRLE
ncbi:tetratricopeptide repeat protein [Paenibacillus lycopersici]|uniref:Tetratricopeptide repeat protein n=1 Tax=Paenibacillus lycopersici TaxID=2704462 RepID=A0A6C0G1B5_9BACL|nr:tetratricopeptide repeat protein [Paenibacillus lycopersici]QHT63238.1 tetratricopeptide repeat protein [Paenibacillus lycopersici]